MDYGIKYRCTFDPIADAVSSPVFLIEIYEKGYSGELFTIKGSTIPVLHQWETDDPKAPIKGSSLTMNFINDGTLPLTDFFSTDDDAFKVQFSYLGNMLFVGFIVQDDCSETLVDFTHEIILSANDNLGLLKDVSLDKANIFSYVFLGTESIPILADYLHREFIFLPDVADNIILRDKIEITGGTPIDGQYTINKIVLAGPSIGVWVDEPLPANYIGNVTYNVLRGSNLLDKTFLSTMIRMCLSVTGLSLNTDIYGKIMEVSQDPNKSFLEQTLVDPQTFLKDDTNFTDCYDVLEKIMTAFKMTIFQANGVWNIVRWDELRYFNNLMGGFRYDSDFNFIGNETKDTPVIAGVNEQVVAETGLIQKINRPLLYTKETFNYQFPRQLLRNFDLKQLGSLIRTYTKPVWIKDGQTYYTNPGGFGVVVATQIFNEYNFTWWNINPPSTGEAFIRVISDDLENELDRYVVLEATGGGNFYGSKDLKSFPIEVNTGDSFVLTFSFKTLSSQPTSGGTSYTDYLFYVGLTNGITTKYFHNPDYTTGTNFWQTSSGFLFRIETLSNTNQWQQVTIDCSRYPMPMDGLLTVYLSDADRYSPKNETQYKDIRFEYAARINDTTKIIGQTHKSSQPGVIKNTEEIEIFVDSSPRNAIAGTLFLNEKVGIIQKRTSKWKHPYGTGQRNLGEIITFEQLFWRSKSRSILEATLYDTINPVSYLSLLSVIKYNYFPELNFVFGRLEIDYKNNKLTGTLWEIWADDELDTDLAYGYDFEYLYSTE